MNWSFARRCPLIALAAVVACSTLRHLAWLRRHLRGIPPRGRCTCIPTASTGSLSRPRPAFRLPCSRDMWIPLALSRSACVCPLAPDYPRTGIRVANT